MTNPSEAAEVSGPPERKQRDILGFRFLEGPCTGEEPFITTAGQVAIGRIDVNKGGSKYKVTGERSSRPGLHICDSTISEKHAKLEWVEDHWTIQDVGSTNGTHVNDTKILGKDCKIELRDGDLIRLGIETIVRVEIAPSLPPDMTVEQYLEHECSMLIKRIQIRSERFQRELRDQATDVKSRIKQATPAA